MHKNGCNERERERDGERQGESEREEREGWRERGGAMETRKEERTADVH